MKKYFNRHQYLFLLVILVFLISLITGLIIYLSLDSSVKTSININLFNLKDSLLVHKANVILPHLITLVIIGLLSLTIIGYISGFIYLFYEGLSLGFSLGYLISIYHMKGLLFGIIYNLIFKGLYIIMLILIIIKLFDIIKHIINMFINKDSISFINSLKKGYLSIIIFIGINTLGDILLNIFSSNIVNIITPLL